MDVINLISKPEPLTDGQPEPGRQYVRAVKFVGQGPRLQEFLAEMNREVGLDAHNLMTVGEMPGVTIEMAREITDPANAELNMVFTFEHVDLDRMPEGSKWDLKPIELPALKKNLNEWQIGLADAGWNSLYFDNHDQPRAVSRFGDDSPEHRVNSAKTLGTVLHMHKGTPYIYQGEELGMTNSYFSDIEQYADIESVNYHADALSLGMEADAVLHSLSVKSRDNARTPMHWDDGSHAGFTEGIPWLPVNPNYVTINARAAIADANSVFHHFRRLIELRHEYRVVAEGRFELLLPDSEQIWAFTRTLDNQVLVVTANCSSTPVEVPGRLPARSWSSAAAAGHPRRRRLASAAAVGVPDLFARLILGLVGRCAGGVSRSRELPGAEEERQGTRRNPGSEQVGDRVVPHVSRPAQRWLNHDAAGTVQEVVERQDGRPLLGGDHAVEIGLPNGQAGGVGELRYDDQCNDHPEVGDQPDQNKHRGADHLEEKQRRGPAPVQPADAGSDQAADDLRAGHDRRRQAGDPVRLRVAPELEQIRLQGVEDIEADAAGENSRQHRGANRGHSKSVVQRSSE